MTLKKSKTVFKGKIFNVQKNVVTLPGGGDAELEVVEHNGGAAVLALDPQDRICMLHQFRHAAGGWIWELPAGKIDADEQPEQTARRELAEEAGFKAKIWEHLGSMYPTPGFCTEEVHLFRAIGLVQGETRHEEHEIIKVHWLELDKVRDMVKEGKIRDAKTLCALYLHTLFGVGEQRKRPG